MNPNIKPTFGEPVRLEGRYEVDPIPGGKRFQGSWLVLDDGRRYVIAYQPVPEHFAFLDKRVVITGRLYLPGPDVQHIRATHLEVQTIDLAPGESPYITLPTQVPPPPVVRNAAEFSKYAGCWAQVVGRLEALEDDPDGYLGIAWLRLADGSQVLTGNVNRTEWSPYMGKVVTVTSRLAQSGETHAVTFELIGWHAICEGSSKD